MEDSSGLPAEVDRSGWRPDPLAEADPYPRVGAFGGVARR
jgi:hypothetical protein